MMMKMSSEEREREMEECPKQSAVTITSLPECHNNGGGSDTRSTSRDSSIGDGGGSSPNSMQLVTHCHPGHGKRFGDFLKHIKSSGYKQLSETCGLSISELETMAARQARQLETQEQLLAAKAQRLRFLKSGGEAERLQRLREKVATQEERLRKLRALRGKVQTSRSSNSALNTDLESLRAVFNEKEKELSLAVAKVDELTRQLEELRRGSKESINNGQSVAAVELEKLRRELMYRQKLREAQATRVAAQRAALTQRQEEALRVDRRIAELQERLHRKRLLNHQLAVTLKHQDNVDDFVSVPTKNDPKYQTLPYNTKLFAPFANKHDQENFEKSMQQMQIIQLDHLQSLHHHNHHQSQQQTQNQTKSVNFSNNIQLHHLISQNHHNAMSANNNALNQQKIHAVSQPTSSPIAASTTTAATTSIPNGLQTVHSTQANNNVSRGKAMPIAPGSSENVFPLVRPSNFLPTGAPSSTGSSSSSSAALPNLGINVLPNSQVGNTKETSSTASNASASGSSVSDGLSPCNNMGTSMTMTNLSSGGAPVRPAKPALPPKPAAKPTPPPRQQAQDAFSFANQRLPTNESSTGTTSSSGTSNNIMPDRSELPIKPKPLFLMKGPPGGNLSSKVSSVSASSNSSSTSADNDTTTVRMSMNRRIEMPPAFLFPESDPPPSDLVPEQLLASLGQNQNAGSQSQRTSPPPNDVVDSSPILQKPTNQNLLLPEEYTLPDLFPAHPNLSHSGYSINNNKETFFINNLVNSNCSNINQLSGGSVSPVGPSSTSSSISSTTSSNLNSNRGVNNTSNSNSGNLNEISGTSAAELITQQQHARNSVILEEQSEINKNNENNEKHISVMSIHVNVESEVPKGETTTTTPNQLESIEAVNDCGSVHSNDQSPDREESTSDSTNNSCSMSANAPGHLIVRRVKKGNLKSTNREHAPLGRRVSFDPLALLLDASLEGELDLVVKTAGEVGNASAANDEGITALHNAICAGHADVVRFLVEFGCDVNAQDSDGWTPLHCAASCNNAGMVKFLVERGACIFATTLSDHETAAAKCEEDEDGFGPCSEYLYSIQEKLGIMNGGVVFAVFDYDAQNPDELSFREADRLMILRKGDEFEREWWWATLGDQQGYVPRNLLGLYPRVVPQRRNES